MAGALFFVAMITAYPVQAQSPDQRQMQQRLNQLENQVQTLSRSVFRGEKPPAGFNTAPPAGSGAIAAFEQRLSDVEARQRELTGQIEKALFDLRQLQDRLLAMSTVQPAQEPVLKPDAATRVIETPVAAPPNTLARGTPADLYDSAFADVRAARYAPAQAKFEDFMTRYPTHPLAGNAQYWLAETFYVRERYADAAKFFAQGYQNYPKGAKAADSLMKLGLSLAKLNKKEDACLTFAQLAKEFPGARTPATKRGAEESKNLGCK